MKPVMLLLAKSAIVTSLLIKPAVSLAEAAPQLAQTKDTKPVIAQITPAFKWAQETGRLAGGAAYCKVEAEVLDDYISRAMAKIASTARNEEDLIVARVEFNNVKSRATIELPKNGCEKFIIIFNRENARLD